MLANFEPILEGPISSALLQTEMYLIPLIKKETGRPVQGRSEGVHHQALLQTPGADYPGERGRRAERGTGGLDHPLSRKRKTKRLERGNSQPRRALGHLLAFQREDKPTPKRRGEAGGFGGGDG